MNKKFLRTKTNTTHKASAHKFASPTATQQNCGDAVRRQRKQPIVIFCNNF